MRKIYLTLVTLGLVLLSACDEISTDERLTYVEPPEAGRAVLIEDYTGQYCVNCPRATEEIERLIEQYGDSVVIAVAIHSGPFSKQKGEPSPLYTEVGDMYFSRWNLSSQPVGLVDRLFDSMPFGYTDWGGGVNYELTDSPTSEAPVTFFIDGDFDTETRTGSFEVQTVGLDENRISGKLQIWLVEDSIDSFQLMPDGSRVEHYNHMHVFRASINDPWGDDVTVGHGEVVTKMYTFVMDPTWVPKHCALVTFFYDDQGVRQVTKTKLNVN